MPSTTDDNSFEKLRTAPMESTRNHPQQWSRACALPQGTPICPVIRRFIGLTSKSHDQPPARWVWNHEPCSEVKSCYSQGERADFASCDGIYLLGVVVHPCCPSLSPKEIRDRRPFSPVGNGILGVKRGLPVCAVRPRKLVSFSAKSLSLNSHVPGGTCLGAWGPGT